MSAVGPITELSHRPGLLGFQKLPNGKNASDYGIFNGLDFTMDGATAAGGSLFGVADANMAVELERLDGNDEAGTALQATTLDDHPLIGARRWGVTKHSKTSLTIWTESYDIGRNAVIRRLGLESPKGKGVKRLFSDETEEEFQKRLLNNPQFKIWEIYLSNLAKSPETKDCIEEARPRPIELERIDGPNPWRNDLYR